MKQQVSNRFIHKTNKLLDKNSLLSVVLLCSNMGYRTKSYGVKSLIQTSNNKTLLQHQIDCLRSQYVNSEIVAVVGYEADKIYKKKIHGCRFIENTNFETTGDYEQIRLALNNIENNKVLIVNGDIYFNHTSTNNLLQNYSYVQTTKNKNSKLEIGLTEVDNQLSILSYGLDTKYWTEFAFFSEAELIRLKDIVYDRSKNKLLFLEAINEVINRGGEFKLQHNSDSSLFKIETITDIKEIKKL